MSDNHQLPEVTRYPEEPKVPDKFKVVHLNDGETRIISIEPPSVPLADTHTKFQRPQ